MLLLRSLPRPDTTATLLRFCTGKPTTIRFKSTRDTLVEFKNANVYRFGAKEPALKDLSLSIQRDQRLVIVGPVSAGKTTLAEALSGRHLIQPVTAAQWPVVDRTQSPYISNQVHLVSFKEESKAFSYSGHYYQERFNFRYYTKEKTWKERKTHYA